MLVTQRIYLMSYKVKTIPKFDKELKRLAKKYPSLKNEYFELVQELKQHPEQGIPIGNNCYKIRLAIASKGKGKSGGARLITYLQITDTTVFLLSIYDKSEQENIPDKELAELLKFITD
jgi:mRNA-degrading endonuclease RelE of RelBE toxin-antitoxin system